MPYYSTGTVSLTANSTAVTGSGTAWATALVTGGVLLCDGLAVPIATVNSNTSITLARPWKGTTGAGKVYDIDLENAAAASAVVFNQQVSALLTAIGAYPTHVNALLASADVGAAQTSLGISAFIKTLLDDANQAAALATLGANDASTLTLGTLSNNRLDQRIGATAKSISDFNTATDNGWYISSSATPTNAPVANWIICHTQSWGAVYLVQEAVEITSQADADTRTWRRERKNSVWGSWTRVRKSETELKTLFPQRPQTAAGAGQFTALLGASGAASVLPAGGSWAYVLILCTTAGALVPASGSAVVAGVAAGGATIAGAAAGYHWLGFAWRIA